MSGGCLAKVDSYTVTAFLKKPLFGIRHCKKAYILSCQKSSWELVVFEKILVPLDGSEHSLDALEKAIQIAKKFDSKITLVHLYSISVFKLTPSQIDDYVLELRKVGEEILAEGQKKAYAEDVPVETQLKEGHVVEGIVELARDRNFDLIVIGARGISKLKELFLGSISHGVTLHAPCPVLVVK